MTADELRELIARMDEIRADYEDFDGDRRGIAECLTAAEYDVAVQLAKQGPALLDRIIYVRFSDDGQFIRKWSREPFDDALPHLVSETAAPAETLDRIQASDPPYSTLIDRIQALESAARKALPFVVGEEEAEELEAALQGHADEQCMSGWEE